VAQVRLARRAQADLDRLLEFLQGQDAALAEEAIRAILDALSVLERHPLIGRSVQGEMRELVISHGRAGYVALYRFLAAQGLVGVLAVRHQREAGFRD